MDLSNLDHIEIIKNKLIICRLSELKDEDFFNNQYNQNENYEIVKAVNFANNKIQEKLNGTDIVPKCWPNPLHYPIKNWMVNSDSILIDIINFKSCIEVFVKFITSISLSDVISSLTITDEFKEYMANSIYSPKIDNWHQFLLLAIYEIKQRNEIAFVEEMLQVLDDDMLTKVSTLIETITQEEISIKKFLELQDVFINMLIAMQILKNYPVCAFENDEWYEFSGESKSAIESLKLDGKQSVVLLHKSNKENFLKLAPIMTYGSENNNLLINPNLNSFSFYDAKTFSAIKFKDLFQKKEWFDRTAIDDFVHTFPVREWRMKAKKKVCKIE